MQPAAASTTATAPPVAAVKLRTRQQPCPFPPVMECKRSVTMCSLSSRLDPCELNVTVKTVLPSGLRLMSSVQPVKVYLERSVRLPDRASRLRPSLPSGPPTCHAWLAGCRGEPFVPCPGALLRKRSVQLPALPGERSVQLPDLRRERSIECLHRSKGFAGSPGGSRAYAAECCRVRAPLSAVATAHAGRALVTGLSGRPVTPGDPGLSCVLVRRVGHPRSKETARCARCLPR